MKYTFSKKCKICETKIHANNKKGICKDCEGKSVYKSFGPIIPTDEQMKEQLTKITLHAALTQNG